MHKFRCVECGNNFEKEGAKDLKCPKCGNRILIHLEGRSLRKKCAACASGDCSNCTSCSH